MLNAIIVGSGAGGGTLARELARASIDVTIIEKGPVISPKKVSECYQTYLSDVEVMETTCFGGTTMVTLGNAVRTCQATLKKMGVDLEEEFRELERDLNVDTLPDSHLGNATKKLMDSARSLGFEPQKMPKFIDPQQCKPCGECALGCKRNAKWTSRIYLEEAIKSGARLIEETPVTEISTHNGQVTGVKSYDKEFKSDIVILSAGAISTPRILKRTGINAGDNLFVDTFVTVGGICKGINYNQEVPMNALIKQDNIILAPHYSGLLLDKLEKFKATKKDIMGLMVKIKDDNTGKVTGNSVIKYNTLNDVELLSKGSAIAGSILTRAGVDAHTLVSTPPRGAHPGGTAALGDVVDKNLETDIAGLFVADASVFPESPGAPPVLTIIALAKRLAKHIIQFY